MKTMSLKALIALVAQAKSSAMVEKAPEVLVLNLKRYNWKHNTYEEERMAIKNSSELKLKGLDYKISSIVSHIGGSSPKSGHYIAYITNICHISICSVLDIHSIR